MFPVSTTGGGMCQGTPDTCQVPAPPAPPIPTPFPNLGDMTQTNPGTASKKVKIENMAVVTKQSEIPMSSGDEAGPIGGVVSGTIKGAVSFKTGSLKVKVEGNPAVFMTCVSSHNGSNANMPAGLVIAPSQMKVVLTD